MWAETPVRFVNLVHVLSAGMEKPGEKEEIPCKGQNLMLFSGSPSKPLILYSGTSKEKLEKHHLKHMGKSPETLESAQLDGRKEQPALTPYNRFYCLKQKLCHQCSPSRALSWTELPSPSTQPGIQVSLFHSSTQALSIIAAIPLDGSVPKESSRGHC